jgi:hypothetical protein
MRIFLLSCALLLMASPAFAGPGAAEGKKSATKPAAKNVAAKKADRSSRPALTKSKAAWPKKLQHRMSRYARFGRTLDREGDLQERVRASMVRSRVEDVQGDRIEFARAKLSKRNRFASRNAFLARKRGTESDLHERQLSRLTRARGRADFRRQMLIPAHELAELKQYKADYAKWGSPLERSGLRMADKTRNERGVEANERKKDWRKRDRPEGDRYLRIRDRGEERREDAREEEGSEIDDEGRGADREEERSEERELEREGEREGDREADREEDAEERSEEAETRSEERSDERTDDRADEKTIRQAEENTRDE